MPRPLLRNLGLFIGLLLVPVMLGAREESIYVANAASDTGWTVEAETGVAWRVTGSATPLSYTVLPEIISAYGPPHFEMSFAEGVLSLRPRFSLIIEPIIKGPESRFVGTTGAGDLEWRHPSGRCAVYFCGGGGVGLMDSKGYETKGGQGQDFNLTWFVHAGARFRLTGAWRWSAGVFFQHISNGHMDKVNPGLNVLGPTVGLIRDF